MNYIRKSGCLASLLAATALVAPQAHADISDGVIRIGVMNDQPGPYADNCGAGSVTSVKLAIEDHGGSVNGVPVEVVIAEEVGRVIAPEPVVVTVGLSLGLLRRLCPDHAMMEQLVEGATVLAVAWQERGPNGGPAEPSCRYADGKLTGGKAWVAGAGGAGGFLVVAEGDAGPVLVLAEAGADGLSVEERRQADGSAMGELSFSGTPAGELAQPGQGSRGHGCQEDHARRDPAAWCGRVYGRVRDRALPQPRTGSFRVVG